MKRLFILFLSVVEKCRRYGIRGIIAHRMRLRKRHREERLFLKTNAADVTEPVPGLTFASSLYSQGSLSKAARDFVVRLRAAGLPFQTFDVPYLGRGYIPECDRAGLVTPLRFFYGRKYNHLVTMETGLFAPKPQGVRLSRIVFWEFASGFAECHPELCHGGELIAMSDFVYEVLKSSVSKDTSVRKILYPFLPPPETGFTSRSALRCKYGLEPDAFVVFFNFDFANSFYRKNPDGVIRAFAEAFSDVPTAMLVFKTQCAKLYPEKVRHLQSLAKTLGVTERLHFIDTFVPQQELYGLTNACDVYISLHRGEGFGLGIAEALSLGKAVVVTDYSGPTEFCKADNCMLIPYEMVDVQPEQRDHGAYLHVKQWAEPDLHAAARALRKLYDEPTLRANLGVRAAAFMRTHYSLERFRESVWAFIQG